MVINSITESQWVTQISITNIFLLPPTSSYTYFCYPRILLSIGEVYYQDAILVVICAIVCGTTCLSDITSTSTLRIKEKQWFN